MVGTGDRMIVEVTEGRDELVEKTYKPTTRASAPVVTQ